MEKVEGVREEVTAEKFDARIRQERLFGAMTSQEKALFRSGYVYKPQKSADQSDPFVKCVNFVTTILLLFLLYLIVQHWNSNSTISLRDYL
jgi:hypothetical protein